MPASQPSSQAAIPGLPVVLLTGFDAFGGDTVNPSWLAVQALDGETAEGHRLVAEQLPTLFDESLKTLRRLVRLHHPALVIAVGQAGGRSTISLERVAINVSDARIGDNAGMQPVDLPVVKAGVAAYFSTLPIKAMLQALEDAGVAAEVSQTAGTFVCNHVFYGLMHHLARQPLHHRARGGFIHVPWLPEQGEPGMALKTMVKGLRIATLAALRNRQDIQREAGSLN
ncbi:MAG: pyroglutamyl-peptidase I [Comamonadaceae bacterium]|nr:MAG: pyroglutamyl-peptidase I [Comamonadaceae bacterium]